MVKPEESARLGHKTRKHPITAQVTGCVLKLNFKQSDFYVCIMGTVLHFEEVWAKVTLINHKNNDAYILGVGITM